MDKQDMKLLKELFNILGVQSLQAIAKETQFIQRERSFTASSFLQFLFRQQSNLVTNSLDVLCDDLFEHDIHITKSALNKRLDARIVHFLQSVFETLMEFQMKRLFPQSFDYTFSKIRILDSTTIKLPDTYQPYFKGIHCSSLKIQLEYDYLTQQPLLLKVTDGRSSDNASSMSRLSNVQKNELLLQDLGYYQLEYFQVVAEKESYYVSKTRKDTQYFLEVDVPPRHPDGRYIEKYRYHRFHMENEIHTMKAGEFREWPLIFIGRHKKIPTRCIVYRHSEEQEKMNRKRENRRRQKSQRKTPKSKLDALHGVTVYVTNLDATVTAEQIHRYYQIRWQIELLFKTMKSDMKIHTIKKVKIERWLCHFYTQCIVFLLSNIITGMERAYLKQKENILLSERMSIRKIANIISQFLEWSWQSDAKWYKHLRQITSQLQRFHRKSIKKK